MSSWDADVAHELLERDDKLNFFTVFHTLPHVGAYQRQLTMTPADANLGW